MAAVFLPGKPTPASTGGYFQYRLKSVHSGT